MVDIKTIKTDSFEMDYFSFGSGRRTFVILPGVSIKPVSLSRDAVAQAYASIARERTVYVFDRKKEIADGYDVADMAEDTATAMRLLGIADADLFGVSQGGMVAEYIAIHFPELVGNLILASTFARDNKVSSEVFGRWTSLIDGRRFCDACRDIFGKIYSDAYRAEYSDAFGLLEDTCTESEMRRFALLIKGCLEFDVYGELDRIKCRTLVLGSWGDRVLSGEASVEIAEALGCGIFMYEKYGHAVYDEAPDFKSHILDFLNIK